MVFGFSDRGVTLTDISLFRLGFALLNCGSLICEGEEGKNPFGLAHCMEEILGVALLGVTTGCGLGPYLGPGASKKGDIILSPFFDPPITALPALQIEDTVDNSCYLTLLDLFRLKEFFLFLFR